MVTEIAQRSWKLFQTNSTQRIPILLTLCKCHLILVVKQQNPIDWCSSLRLQWKIFSCYFDWSFYSPSSMEQIFQNSSNETFFSDFNGTFFCVILFEILLSNFYGTFLCHFDWIFLNQITMDTFFVSIWLKLYFSNFFTIFVRVISIEILLSMFHETFFLCHFDWSFTLRLLWIIFCVVTIEVNCFFLWYLGLHTFWCRVDWVCTLKSKWKL